MAACMDFLGAMIEEFDRCVGLIEYAKSQLPALIGTHSPYGSVIFQEQAMALPCRKLAHPTCNNLHGGVLGV